MFKQNIVNEEAEVMTDEELAAVVGGLTCEQGIAVANVYKTLGDIVQGSNPTLAANFYGKSQGRPPRGLLLGEKGRTLRRRCDRACLGGQAGIRFRRKGVGL